MYAAQSAPNMESNCLIAYLHKFLPRTCISGSADETNSVSGSQLHAIALRSICWAWMVLNLTRLVEDS